MKDKIYLTSPFVLIIDPIFLLEQTFNYLCNVEISKENIYSVAKEINKVLFPYGGAILGLYYVNEFDIPNEYEYDVTQIVRIFKKDFEELDLSETCLFGVDSAEILLLDLKHFKDFLTKCSEKKSNNLDLKAELFNQINNQGINYFKLITAFDINNSFTDFVGDGRYAVTEDFIKKQ